MDIYDVFEEFFLDGRNKINNTNYDVGKDGPHIERMGFFNKEYVMIYKQTSDTPTSDIWEALILHVVEGNRIMVYVQMRKPERFYSPNLFEKMLLEQRLKELK